MSARPRVRPAYVAEFVDESDVAMVRAEEAPSSSSEGSATGGLHREDPVECTVSTTRELRDPSDPGSTLHMEIDISGHKHASSGKIGYRTADNLGVLPENDASVVEAVAKAPGYDDLATGRSASSPLR